MPDPTVWTALAGGAFGSTFTYALTWFRERRRTLDSYRAPQRQAIGGIVAASYEYLLRHLELRTAMGDTLGQARAGGPITSADEQWSATKAMGSASIALESAFQTGALTVDDAVCWEALVVAYAAFTRLNRQAQAQPLITDGLDDVEPNFAVIERNFAAIEQYIAVMKTHCDQLGIAVSLLVDAAYGRVSPVGDRGNGKERRKAEKGLSARRDELLGESTPAGSTPPAE